MENLKEFLTSIWEDYYLKTGHSLNAKFIIEKYDAFKTRPREPEAINRNEQAKELCVHYDGCDGGQKSKCGKYSVKDCYEKAQ